MAAIPAVAHLRTASAVSVHTQRSIYLNIGSNFPTVAWLISGCNFKNLEDSTCGSKLWSENFFTPYHNCFESLSPVGNIKAFTSKPQAQNSMGCKIGCQGHQVREIHVSSSSMSKNHSICWFLLWDRKNSIKVFVSKRYFHFNLEMKQNPELFFSKKQTKPNPKNLP